jgi:YHS domain-containing protein
VPGLIRLLLIFVAVWTAIRFVARLLGAGRPPSKGARRGSAAPPRPAEKLVQDPQCGVWIPERRALKGADPRGAVYFCSEECRAKHSSAG